MELKYSDQAKADLKLWHTSGNKAVMQKIRTLLLEIADQPFKGTGKPEPLKYGLSGFWSRRIDTKNRIVYKVVTSPDGVFVVIASLRGHYGE